jgi:stringent starvation protein B
MNKAEISEETKRQTIERMLDAGKVMIHVDSRHPGVSVPAKYADDQDLVLCISHRFREHGAYCRVDDRGIEARLNFGTIAFVCVVPWDALTAAYCEAVTEAAVWNRAFLPALEKPNPRPRFECIDGGKPRG